MLSEFQLPHQKKKKSRFLLALNFISLNLAYLEARAKVLEMWVIILCYAEGIEWGLETWKLSWRREMVQEAGVEVGKVEWGMEGAGKTGIKARFVLLRWHPGMV